MGRKKKYTEEELKEAQRKWSKSYYVRNKQIINNKAMEKYYELRKNIQSDNTKS
jgi:hypothetical protein